MTLKGRYALCFKIHASLEANHENLHEYRPMLSSTMTLVCGNVGLCGYSRWFPGEGTSNNSGLKLGLSKTAISVISLAIHSVNLEIGALLHSDMQSIDGFLEIPKCVNVNDLEWLFHVKFSFRAALSGFLLCDFRK